MEDQLTGKVFVKHPIFRSGGKKEFQLEAMIGGNITRLVGEGDIPKCVDNPDHKLEFKGAYKEIWPQTYLVGCDHCGYSAEVYDINGRFISH